MYTELELIDRVKNLDCGDSLKALVDMHSGILYNIVFFFHFW